MSRTRLIRPAFFSDERMARTSIPTRLVYIGLWTLCDDAGYFERRPAEIAVALFPYERVGRRQKLVDAALLELAELDRIRWLECGDHGLVPTLPDHVQKAGNHAYTHKARHDSSCAATLFRSRAARGRIDVAERESLTGPVRGTDKSRSFSGSSSFSDSDSGRAAARGLKETATETGGFVATLAKGER